MKQLCNFIEANNIYSSTQAIDVTQQIQSLSK